MPFPTEKKLTLLDMLSGETEQKLTVEPTEVPDDWSWDCAEDVKAVMVKMGLYETMRSLMYVIQNSRTSTEVSMAKSKMEAIGKAMVILKNATTINEASGANDDDKVSHIEISLKRDVEKR